jgi:signal transduction histidine kinase
MVQSIKNYITKQNQLTNELQKLNEQLEQKDKLKDEFINIAAHELRAPIQPIVSLSDVIRSRRLRSISTRSNLELVGTKDDSGDGDDVLLDIIVRNAKRLQALSENILDITKIESKTLKLNKEKFNINEKISNVIADIKSKEEGQGEDKIAIIFDEQEVDPIIVEADKLRIYQVISNLLVNAVKFTKSRICESRCHDNHNVQQVDGTIIVFTSRKKYNNIYEKEDNNKGTSNHHNDVAIISIKDRGIGIDPNIKDKLFSKFVTKSDSGTGLGLYISKGIVEAHGGKIWAENNADEKGGATFAFSLPIT